MIPRFKTVRLILLSLLLMQACGQEAWAFPSPGGLARIEADGLRVREQPNLEAFVLGHLNTDDIAEVLEITPEDQTINGLTAPWLRIRTVETVEGWVFGAYATEEVDVDPSDLTFSGDFARDIVYTEPIDLSEVNEAARTGDALRIAEAWKGVPQNPVTQMVRNEREVLRYSTGVWTRGSAEAVYEAFVQSAPRANRMLAMFPPTINGGLFPGNHTVFAYANAGAADWISGLLVGEWEISGPVFAGDRGLFAINLDGSADTDFKSLIFLIDRIESPVFPELDGQYEISSIFLNLLPEEMSMDSLERVKPGTIELKEAIYGNTDTLSVDPTV